MKCRRLPITIALVIMVAAMASRAAAGVVVLANRTADKVTCTLTEPDGRDTRQTLDRGQAAPVPIATTVTVVFDDGPQQRRQTLQANGIYYFQTDGGRLGLVQQLLPGFPANPPASERPAADRDSVCTIPVKLMVDDKEPTVQALWEKRYRERMAAASEIIARYCPVRFEVVGVARWTSDNTAHDLEQLIAEFERTVKPAPARLAIGFTGQYATLRGDKHLGGTRGPFRSHILIREWGQQITEPERLEILVHELGHFLGAVHSPERQSAMRPDLSDRQSRLRAFHIGFDAPNTMILYLVGEQFGSRPLVHLGQLPTGVKEQLRPLYTSLAAGLPNDPAAPRYLAMLDQSLGLVAGPPQHLGAVMAGARSVVKAVAEAAATNRQLPDVARSRVERQAKRAGDKLTEYYVRQAAAAAGRLSPEIAAKAFLLGLGVALDDSSLLRAAPIVGNFWQQIESDSQRAARLAVLGAPTMQARHDLAQHFAVSATLSVLVGPQGAEGAGILKELSDARGGSGFSFVDLSADLAGIHFAGAVESGKIPLSHVAEHFVVADFLPDAAGLKEGMAWDEFVNTFGYPTDSRFSREREAILARIRALPGHKDGLEIPSSNKGGTP